MPKKSVVNAVLAHVVSAGAKVLSLLSGLLAAFLILYSGYVLYDNLYIQNQAFGSSWELLKYRPDIIDDGAAPVSGGETLAKINKDYRAWLTVYDTPIDYPVMQGENDLYYASHDVHGKSSLSGAIYLSAENSGDLSDTYNVIYGHHMDNGAMFGGLDDFADRVYFDGHREGILVTPDAVYDLRFFAVLRTDAYESAVYSVGDRDLSELMDYLGEHAVVLDRSAAEGAEQIVALSTCSDSATDGRILIFAVMTERNPEPVPPVPPVPPGPEPTEPESPTEPETGTPPVPGPTEPEGPVPVTPVPVPPTPETTVAEESSPAEETEAPEDPFIERFQPTGSAFGRDAWALVNLICLILTAYLLLPLLHLKAKYSRAGQMEKVNEANAAAGLPPVYDPVRFRRRFRLGILLEAVVVIAALITFILTEDMRLPMILIDRWTPLMALFLLVCWVIDLRLVRYRSGGPEEEAPAPQEGPKN